MLKIEGICKAFSTNAVLKDVSLTLKKGSIVGLCGASGIGKSTLAKIVCGLEKPDAGYILYNNRLLCSSTMKYDRKRALKIQMVYQQPFAVLDPSQKIRAGFEELIRYHKLAKGKAVDDLIEQVCQKVGLDNEVLNHLPHQISGGEAQRIAIAKSLLFEPEILVLDEATSMLDVSTQANVLALVKRQLKSRDGIIFMISHDMELVEKYCDEIYALEGGALVKKDIENDEQI